MSLPARMQMYVWHIELVRLKCGSTWMRCAPRSRARIAHREPTGWASARFEPMIRMQSLLARSCWKVVAPPRPNDVPKLGTVEECHMRAWFSIWSAPRAVYSFFMR